MGSSVSRSIDKAERVDIALSALSISRPTCNLWVLLGGSLRPRDGDSAQIGQATGTSSTEPVQYRSVGIVASSRSSPIRPDPGRTYTSMLGFGFGAAIVVDEWKRGPSYELETNTLSVEACEVE